MGTIFNHGATVRRLTGACLLAFSIAASGCASVPPVWYESGKADPAQSVVVRLDGDAIFRSLDGRELADPYTTWNGGYAAVREIRISPGVHNVAGRIARAGLVGEYEFREDFQPGHYLVSAHVLGYRLIPSLKRVEPGR